MLRSRPEMFSSSIPGGGIAAARPGRQPGIQVFGAIANQRSNPEKLWAAAFAAPFPQRMHADRQPLSYVDIRKELRGEFHMHYASVALLWRST